MTTATTATQTLPRAAPARVLALGAYLKNAACLLDGATVRWSTLHGDLSTPEACVALEASAHELLRIAGGHIDAVAHDLHPDFYSTQLAVALAACRDLPALLENVAHKSAMIGFQETEAASHRRWTRQGTLPDFKTASRVALSEAPGLALVCPEALDEGFLGWLRDRG